MEVNYLNRIDKDNTDNDGIILKANNNVNLPNEDNEAYVEIIFTMRSVESNSWENEKNKKRILDDENDQNIIGKLRVNYKIICDFSTEREEKMRDALLEIIEPYFRKEVETLLSNMKLPNFILPYRFWENEDN
ncbi:TPA: hypothetical protein O8797_002311 [Staphylococcus aureus]|uniref:hypothetical protein n=1 Tax=Staphylococcus aureus TaxID=1280 RepID=UPI000197A8CD|nr:hypothetical protein [Staphylococcus aureus]EHS79932.1 hypothetical protein IS189_0936 [Staphylococcus aureus subsp. aureus IS-189]ADL64914.1 pathogenicity island protein [Staphylococcus aureus subsp. aureus str. JKD6008]AEB87933.1 Pathogenicity island protein [Staphylococcus aureus subsp. aureus T0131]AEB87989.1 Pathogenicity island protein [Staphylococcus aureus subsp. aureus T0131]AEB89107.1 Pathogenicity island protein [Staphylococcus aureus subsp. aureus T0131]